MYPEVHAGLHCEAPHVPPWHICDAVLQGLPQLPQL